MSNFLPHGSRIQSDAKEGSGACIAEAKTFFCDIKFTDVRQSLIRRKWKLKRPPKRKENLKTIASKHTHQKGGHSTVDFLWRNYRRIDFASISGNQYVNHLQGITSLSIKSNLWTNLSQNKKIRLPYTVVVKDFKIEKTEIFKKLSVQETVLNDLQKQKEVDSTTKTRQLIGTNTFIIKPVASSRGRGIEIVSSARELELYLSQATDAKPMVVQKYISNPALIKKHKFDIRLWVLVSSINPLRVYTFNQPYARLSNYEFTMLDNNKLIHLTNNSIQRKQDETLRTSNSSTNDAKMLSCQQLIDHYGVDLWRDTIYKQLKEQSYLAIEQVLPLLTTTGKGFELLGFDYMLDENLNAYLIEVNLDPDQSHSTVVTRDLVPKCIDSVIEILTEESNSGQSNSYWDLVNLA